MHIHHWVGLVTMTFCVGTQLKMASVGDLLIEAARSGDVVALDGLLQEGIDGVNVNLQTEGGVSLLMHAIIGRYALGAYWWCVAEALSMHTNQVCQFSVAYNVGPCVVRVTPFDCCEDNVLANACPVAVLSYYVRMYNY